MVGPLAEQARIGRQAVAHLAYDLIDITSGGLPITLGRIGLTREAGATQLTRLVAEATHRLLPAATLQAILLVLADRAYRDSCRLSAPTTSRPQAQ